MNGISPGGADVARLRVVAAAVLQGALAVLAVVVSASPVEVAAVLRAQPAVMLSVPCLQMLLLLL